MTPEEKNEHYSSERLAGQLWLRVCNHCGALVSNYDRWLELHLSVCPGNTDG